MFDLAPKTQAGEALAWLLSLWVKSSSEWLLGFWIHGKKKGKQVFSARHGQFKGTNERLCSMQVTPHWISKACWHDSQNCAERRIFNNCECQETLTARVLSNSQHCIFILSHSTLSHSSSVLLGTRKRGVVVKPRQGVNKKCSFT